MRNRYAYWFKSMYPNPCAHDMKNIYWLGIAVFGAVAGMILHRRRPR